ncbi:ankyrin repeat-containing domain protein [Haematococcus lacustris]
MTKERAARLGRAVHAGCGKSALHLAALAGDTQAVLEGLFPHSAPPRDRSTDGVGQAGLCSARAEDEVRGAHQTNRRHTAAAAVAAVDATGRTALHKAMQSQAPKLRLVEQLLAAGADAAARDRDGRTALHLAALTGCEARVRLLLHAAQADPDVQDAAGYTALHLAVHRACGSPVMGMLLQAGADVNVADRDGRTPLHLAALRPHRHCAGTGCCSLAALLRAGAAVDAQDKDGRTPLHCVLLEGVEAAQLDKVQHINHHKAAAAAARTHPRALQWQCHTLLAHGAPPNLPDALGRTPLHLAVAASSLAAAQLLLKAGADWLAADHAGATPASMAQASPRTATLARLLAAHDAGEVGGELSRAHIAPVPGGSETADLSGPGSSCNPGDRRKGSTSEAVPLSGAVAELRVKNERRTNDATMLHQGPGTRVTSAVGPRGGAAVMKAMELQHLRGRVSAGLLTDSGSDSGTEV